MKRGVIGSGGGSRLRGCVLCKEQDGFNNIRSIRKMERV